MSHAGNKSQYFPSNALVNPRGPKTASTGTRSEHILRHPIAAFTLGIEPEITAAQLNQANAMQMHQELGFTTHFYYCA
eukprot:s1402_g4.t1